MKIKSLLTGLSFSAALALTAGASQAETISVTIKNLTHGTYFTPLLVTAHGANGHLFELGQEASAGLQAMAEGGSLDALVETADSWGAVSSVNPAEGLLAPGAYTMVTDMDTGTNGYLSIVAMVLPSNDGFVGLDSWAIPSEAGTYTINLNAYDAGTEANNELVAEGSGESGVLGIPANPGGNGGTGGTGVTTTEENDTVHIHRGVLGDTSSEGGASDLDSRIHRWLNPVAQIIVTVQ